ncbi:MAG: EF-hand domain-containing protein [Paracoccaceae bacterium]
MQAARKAPNIGKMFKHLDKDKDGMISAEEFASRKERGHKGRRK